MTTLSEKELREATQGNDAFSKRSLGLQLSLDSTSLGAYKFCPTFYLYSIILGYQLRRKNVDLQFGILVHSGIERYHRLRSGSRAGIPCGHEESLRQVVQQAQVETWDFKNKRAQVWPDPEKNRLSLLRLLVWYLDRWKDDPIQTLKWKDGSPAVEVNFHFPTGFYSREDELFLLCGYFDRLGRLNGKVYVPDVKTTRHQLDSKYFSNFTPDNQFTIYTIASRTVLEELAEGVILDACQIGATFARFHREFIPRSTEALTEWLEDLGRWLRDMEQSARERHWRMNDRMCWNCDFKGVCSRAPSRRKAWLDVNFERRVWDPTKERTDT